MGRDRIAGHAVENDLPATVTEAKRYLTRAAVSFPLIKVELPWFQADPPISSSTAPVIDLA
jgi:hypothetical protein